MNYEMVWRFVRLRYVLLWALVRTSKGRSASHAAGLLLLFCVGVVVLNGSFAIAMIGSTLHHSAEIALALLTSFGLNAIVASVLVLGAGPGTAFDEPALRRYPLSSVERFAIRHLIGLLEPIWLLLLVGSMSLAFGFAAAGTGVLPFALLSAILFVLTAYVSAIIVVLSLHRSSRPGAHVVLLATVALSATPLATMILFEARKPTWWGNVDRLLRVLPAGPAALAMTSTAAAPVAAGIGALAAWLTGLVAVLLFVDRHSARPRSAPAQAPTSYESLRRLGVPPLVTRALLYQLRCARLRVNLVISAPIIAIFGGLVGRGMGPEGPLAFTLVFLFLGAGMATNACALNLLGHDGRGLQRHVIASGTLGPALTAASVASVSLGVAVVLLATVVWFPFWHVRPTVDVATLCVATGLCGAFVVNGLGLWTSVLDPYSESFNSIRMERPFAVGNLMMAALLVAVFAGAFRLVVTGAFTAIRTHWYYAPLVSMLAYALYRLALQGAIRVAERRQETLLHDLAGGDAAPGAA